MARNRSDERTDFLRSIITTAVEGGTGYWAQVSQYQYIDDFSDPSNPRVAVVVGEQVGDEARAVLHEMLDDESGYHEEGLVLDIEKIASAIAKILAPGSEISLNSRIRGYIAEGNAENDGGCIDSDAADCIAQVALLGEIRYG